VSDTLHASRAAIGGTVVTVAARGEQTKRVVPPPRQGGMSSAQLRYRRAEPVLLGVLCLVIVLVAWQVSSDAGWVNKLFVSSPTSVARQLGHYVTTHQFWLDLETTGVTFLEGLGLSLVVGLILGLAMGFSKRIGYFFDYAVSLSYAAPRIALVPILILWFGIGRTTGVAMVFLLAVFPIIINTMTGVQNVDATVLEMARSQKASTVQLFRTVIIPGSLPSVISGIRLAIGNGLIGVIVAEFLAGSSAGLGYTMQQAAQQFDAAQLFAGLIVISVLGLIATQILRMVERHFQGWRTS
jgi:ABC-type nitrate/sulfonate/bicarbonate transport system permease component